MERQRQNPDQLLRAIGNDTADAVKGKLKIFFGYAAGDGGIIVPSQAKTA